MAMSRSSLRGWVRRVSSHVEAAGLGLGEEALDRPALAVGLERGAGGSVGDDDQPLAPDELRGEVEQRRACGVLAGAEAGVEEAAAAGAMQAGAEHEFVPGLVGDAQIVPQADGEGDVVIVEELEPLGADELAVAQQDADEATGKCAR